jgi:hypothetical protein
MNLQMISAKVLAGINPATPEDKPCHYNGSSLTQVKHFVGWVELAPSIVGFLRRGRTNLHFPGVFAKYETQQQPIFFLSQFNSETLMASTQKNHLKITYTF